MTRRRISGIATIAFGLLFVAASARILVMPKAFASLPDGQAWTHAQLTSAIQAGDLTVLALTNDAHGDVVARTRDGGLVVYRASAEAGGPTTDASAVLTTVASAGASDILTAGASDAELAAFGRAVAEIPPPDMAAPMALWLFAFVAFLGSFMVWLAGRTSFRLSQPFGARFGVGTDRTP
jgi:hypothetical protein